MVDLLKLKLLIERWRFLSCDRGAARPLIEEAVSEIEELRAKVQIAREFASEKGEQFREMATAFQVDCQRLFQDGQQARAEAERLRAQLAEARKEIEKLKTDWERLRNEYERSIWTKNQYE